MESLFDGTNFNAELNSFRLSIWAWKSYSSLNWISYRTVYTSNKIHSNVCAANGFLSCYLGSHGAVVLWSLDVTVMAIRQLKPVKASASRSLESYLKST